MCGSDGRAALIVANGAMPRAAIIRAEASHADFVLAADGGVNQLMSIGMAPNAVLGDFDSIAVVLPDSVQRIEAPDQNRTDLEKAVLYLIDEGYESITITAATGNRLDHTFGALGILCKYNLRLVDDIGVAVSVRGPGQIGLETFIGQTISIMPMGVVSGLTTRNLKWNLDSAQFDFAERDGTSNVATASFVEVTLHAGIAVVYAHHAAIST